MIYFILCFIFLILILVVGWTVKNGIGPMPTSYKVKRALLEHLPTQRTGIIYELGAGWGTLAFSLAKKYPQAQVIAYENSPIPYGFSKIRNFFFQEANLKIIWKDFFKVDLSDAGLVVCYLYPGAMEKLKTKFEKELKTGTLVVSHTFAVPTWTSQETYEVSDIYRTKIYFYNYDSR